MIHHLSFLNSEKRHGFYDATWMCGSTPHGADRTAGSPVQNHVGAIDPSPRCEHQPWMVMQPMQVCGVTRSIAVVEGYGRHCAHISTHDPHQPLSRQLPVQRGDRMSNRW